MRRCFFSLAVVLVVLAGAGQASAQPDLRIQTVAISGATARVQGHNGGMAAGACVVRLVVVNKANGMVVWVGNRFFPALGMGSSDWVSITAPFPKMAMHEWQFKIDATNVVAESNELNNRFFVP